MISAAALLPTADALLSIATSLTTIVAKHSRKKARAPEPDRVRRALEHRLVELTHWASEVRVDPRDRPRTLADLFVNLDLEVSSRVNHGRMRVSDLADHSSSFAILGQPGGGKTTSLMYIAAELLKLRSRDANASIPLLVRFRDLQQGRSLIEELVAGLGGVPDDMPAKYRDAVMKDFLFEVLREIPVTLLLDGLDEARSSGRESIHRDLSAILTASQARVLLTSRTAEYRFTLPSIQVVEIQPLSTSQVKELVDKWLRRPADRETFIKQVQANPYAGTETRPLTLVVLALIFIRKGEIPRHPRTVYERILRLFLEDWDESRGVVRESKYSDFSMDRKEAFLEALAFELTRMDVRGVFGHQHLIHAYNAIHRRFSLPSHQASAVAREIESHSGLILERGSDEFEFFHLTIQEYLTARFLGRRGDLATTGLDLRLHPNELAVATAWSSDPGVFLLAIVRGIIRYGAEQLQLWDRPFITPYFERLAFEQPNWERGLILGLGLIHLGHFYCTTEKDSGSDNTALQRFLANTEVAASIRMFKGRYLSPAPVQDDTHAGVPFRVETYKLRDSADEGLKAAMREYPLPSETMLPKAYLDSIQVP